MSRDTRWTLALALGLTVAALLIACGSQRDCCGPPAVASVTVSPDADTLTVGDTVRLVATVKDASDHVLTDRSVTWRSGDPSVAAVSASGLVTAVSAKTVMVTITATSENATGYASILVRLRPVASVAIAPVADTLQIGHTVQLVVTVRDSAQHVLTDRVITWTSSNSSVATVSVAGLVTGVSANALAVTITATSEGVKGYAAIIITAPLPTDTADFASVDAGTYHTCGRTPAGAVYCWGSGSYGELGTGSTGGALLPQAVIGGHTFTAVSVGGPNNCGLTATGAAWCWGSDAYGTLGSGGPGPETCSIYQIHCGTQPYEVDELVSGPFRSLSAGWGVVCGLVGGGSAYCWGDNTRGALGVGSDTALLDACDAGPCSWAPRLVSRGLTFADIVTGVESACGLTSGGAAYCWGDNQLGTLGIGNDTGPDSCGGSACSRTPVPVAGGHTFVALRMRYYYACGRTTEGDWLCWGANNYGQLGNGTTGPETCFGGTIACSTQPMALASGVTFATLFTGWHHGCGIAVDGTAYCWGQNDNAQLGDGTTTNSLTPVAVAGGLKFASLSPYYYHSCGLTTDGVAYCWGNNTWGQLGDGITTASLVPVRVARPGAAATASTATPVRAIRLLPALPIPPGP